MGYFRMRQVIVSSLVALALLWGPTLYVIIYNKLDNGTKILYKACLGLSTLTIYMVVASGVILASRFCGHIAVNMIFGDAWKTIDTKKQRKIIGYFAKVLMRMVPSLLLLFLVVPYYSINDGLFGKYNMGQAYREVVAGQPATTCAHIGMTPYQQLCIQAWVFARLGVMAAMVWELSFIPELPWDAWMHHGWVILFTTWSTDEWVMSSTFPGVQPLVDGIGVFTVLGAALNFPVEAAVLGYHFDTGSPRRQAAWMLASCVIQFFITVVCYFGLPIASWLIHVHRLPLILKITPPIGIGGLLFIECHLMLTKLRIRKKKIHEFKGQLNRTEEPLAQPNQANGQLCGSFAEPTDELRSFN